VAWIYRYAIDPAQDDLFTTQPYSNNTAASSGRDACLVRGRNSSLIHSSMLVVRRAFHCDCANCKKVNSSPPASWSGLTIAFYRSRHLRSETGARLFDRLASFISA
jgi:hypothetical protein